MYATSHRRNFLGLLQHTPYGGQLRSHGSRLLSAIDQR
jgi:hypothetical protein